MRPFISPFAVAIVGYGLVVAALNLFAAAPAPATAAVSKAELGRLLFWDPLLSGQKDVACATCHHPEFAYADGRELALGTRSIGLGPERVDASKGEIPVVRRNSPTVLNVAFNGLDQRGGGGRGGGGRGGGRGGRGGGDGGGIRALPASFDAVDQSRAPMFWDNRVRSLEVQALAPIVAHEEMRGSAYAETDAVGAVVARLRGVPRYVELFREAYGPGTTIDAAQLSGALAEFQRTLVTRNSPLDRHLAGDPTALTPQQRRGLDAFDRANCTECHRGPMLSDFQLHALGVREHPGLTTPDSGDGRFRFRTPTLRNVGLTAPYMHNGMLATLEDVLEFYDRGRSENVNVANGGNGRGGRGGRGGGQADGQGAIATLDRDFRGVRNMSAEERQDIVAFLHSLTDESFDRFVPASVPSGLRPGGNIGTASSARTPASR